MAEPWEMRTDDSRSSDTLVNFIIFYEDDLCEPLYFKKLEQPGKTHISELTNQLAGSRQLQRAIVHCVKEGLMEFRDGRYQLPEHVTENIWCVFDRDRERPAEKDGHSIDDADFNQAIASAVAMGLQVAWSNDVFELWLLLHFEDVPIGAPLHRTYVYERLTAILKVMEGKTAEFEVITAKVGFNYKGWMKKRNRFGPYLLPLLKGRTQLAIDRAKLLAAQFQPDTPFHERNPCTMAYQLVEALLAAR